MNDTSKALQELRQLTDDERLDAVENARATVTRKIGDKPSRDTFANNTISRYPAWLTRAVGGVMAIVFIASALPSLFRLFTAGRDYFMHGITDGTQGALVGVSTFLLAEFLIILSTISARVYFHGRSRLIFIVPISLGLAVALVGNYVIAKPADIFGWLETIVPPIAVLFLALIGERLILDAIEARHANERDYQHALTRWQLAVNSPEQSEHWALTYANALRQAIINANTKGTGATARRELINTLTPAHWRLLVIRELRADSWFNAIDMSATATTTTEPSAGVLSNGHTPVISATEPARTYTPTDGHHTTAEQSTDGTLNPFLVKVPTVANGHTNGKH